MRSKIALSVVIIIIVVAGFWYWRSKAPRESSYQKQVQQVKENLIDTSLGSNILDKTQNPIKNKLPEANPFQKIETNPLKNIYKNPF